MKINDLKQKYLYLYLHSTSIALIKLKQLNQIWLLNCFEGSQHTLANKNIKIAQIKKIIIVHNIQSSVNGLLGLLSSISLNAGCSQIDIYGPQLLQKYIFWGRKYSKTNFRQRLYFHDALYGKMFYRLNPYLYSSLPVRQDFYDHYSLLIAQRSGVFNCSNAKNYNVPFGPLYGYLKEGQNFVLPDGSVVYSRQFICGYCLGSEVALVNFCAGKLFTRIIKSMTYVLYS